MIEPGVYDNRRNECRERYIRTADGSVTIVEWVTRDLLERWRQHPEVALLHPPWGTHEDVPRERSE